MKYIRIKRKQLLLGVTSIALLLGASFVYKEPLITLYKNHVPTSIQEAFSGNTKASFRDEANRLHDILSSSNFSLYQLIWFEPTGVTGINSTIQYYDGKRIYQEFQHYNKTKDLLIDEPEYYFDVLLSQWFSGNVKTALAMRDAIDVSKLQAPYNDYYHIIQAAIGLTFYDLDLVETSCASIENVKYKDLSRNIRSFMKLAFDYGEDIEPVFIFHDEYDDTYFDYFSDISRYANTINSDRRELGSATKSNRSIKGQVTIANEPFLGAFVYQDIHSGMYSSEGFDGSFTAIGKDGNYSFETLYDDAQTVGFIVPYQRIVQMEVSFPNAHYYQDMYEEPIEHQVMDFTAKKSAVIDHAYVENDILYFHIQDDLMTEDRSYYLDIRLTNPTEPNARSSATITCDEEGYGSVDLASLRTNSSFTFGSISSEDAFKLSNFTEPLYLSDEYYLRLSRPITRSITSWNGAHTHSVSYKLFIEGQDGYNQGDLLLSQGKPLDAIEWYKEHPTVHNLSVIVHLYYHGYIPVEEEYYTRMTGDIPSLAIKYSKELIALDGETYSRLWMLLDSYAQLGDLKNERLVLEKMLSTNPSQFLKIRLAKIDILEGNAKVGLEELKKLKADAEDANELNTTFMLYGINDELTENVKTLYDEINFETVKPFFEIVNEKTPEDAWNYLLTLDDSHEKTMLQLLLIDDFPSDTIDYRQLSNNQDTDYSFSDFYKDSLVSIKDQTITKLLKQIKSYWFD